MMISDRRRFWRHAITVLLLVLSPNVLLIGAGLLMRTSVQQVTEAQAGGQFGLARLLRQVGLNAFLLLPMGIWLLRRRTAWASCGWGRKHVGRAVGVGILSGAAALLSRASPFAPENLVLPDTWWALATYAVVAVAEETLYRGFLQSHLTTWLGRWWGFLTTALLFTALHLPARLLGGEPLLQALTYSGAQILPLGLLLGAAMLLTGHAVTPTLLHLAWNWASVVRQS